MVKKSDLSKLINKNSDHFKGHQVGRLLIYTLLDQVKGLPERVSPDEIIEMVDRLANPYERMVYNTYVNIYAELVDAYNSIQGDATNARLALSNLQLRLTDLTRSAFNRNKELQKPVIITERQYRRYETNYKKYLKEVADKTKNKEITVLYYLQTRLEFVMSVIQDTLNDDPNALDWDDEENANVRAVLKKYQDEEVPSKWHGFLNKVYKIYNSDAKETGNSYPIDNVKWLILQNLISTGVYDEELKKRAKKAGKDFDSTELKAHLLNFYIDARYSKDMNKNDASEFAFKEAGIELDALEDVDQLSNMTFDLPDPLTKYDAVDDYLFDITQLREEGSPRSQRISDEDADKLDQFSKEELFDILKATAQDLINEHPDMKELLEVKTKEDLDKKITGKELAKAGDGYYKDFTSITYLRKEPDYGIWNVFPKRNQQQARNYGFSVFHDEGDSQYSKMLEEDSDNSDLSFIGDILVSTHKTEELESNYQTIEDYLKKYQAYSAFIDGIVQFSGCDKFTDFKGIPEQEKVLIALGRNRTLRNLELYKLDEALDKKKFKTYEKKIKEAYPLIDPNEERIEPSTKEALGSYIAKVFSPDHQKPVITSVLFSDIAGGVENDNTEE